ncbi:hypothetical protein BV210_18035 (plasmid) [Halorientalis sp. IM1011]|uniref:DsbA family protein n=1 Tax=Halorientalis sp. IM1011 TaxID=1932360 RepID=UPI00097CC185|nr:thioredoxin domain-containing protein [Halorientalis sp. IM1011]AQL44666.1 hypothetical protein BV210_18035 [Halorientalis sp. IM1011]
MSPHTRRRYLATAGTLVAGVAAGCSGGTDASGSPTSTPTDTETAADRPASFDPDDRDAVASASIPTTGTDYAVMGDGDAPLATLYGGWKCPYTRQFVRNQFPEIVRQYVQPGDLRIRFRAVRFLTGEPHGADEPRANRAGLAVWHERPEAFWRYFTRVFESQPPETRQWATVDTLLDHAAAAGIEQTDTIREAITDGRYRSLWQETMDRVHQLGFDGIPRLRLHGEATAPTLDPAATRQQLSALGRSDG